MIGAAVLGFLVGFILGLLVKVGRSEIEQQTEDYLKLSKPAQRSKKP